MAKKRKYPWGIRLVTVHAGTPYAETRWELRGGRRTFGKRIKMYFDTQSAALKKARELAAEFQAHGAQAVELAESERVDAVEALAILRDRGASLREAARFFLKHSPQHKPCTVREGIVRFLETRGVSEKELDQPGKHRQPEARARRFKNYSHKHRVNLAYRLRPFVEDFGGEPLGVVSAKRPEIKAWLLEKYPNPVTLKNHRSTLHSFFEWAVEQRLMPENPAKPWKDLSAVFRDHQKRKKPGILNPGQLEKLLSEAIASDKPMVAYFAIGGFSGIRTEEIGSIRWGTIKPDSIHIASEIAKTGDARDIPIHPTLAKWLSVVERGKVDDFVVPADFENRRRELCRKLKLSWPHNALRHSFGSYRQAVVKNMHLVSDEMRHDDVETFKRYYLNRGITPEEAKQYWAIAPQAKKPRTTQAGRMNSEG